MHVFNPRGYERWRNIEDYTELMKRFLQQGQGWSATYTVDDHMYREVLFHRDNVLLFSRPKLRDVSTCYELMDQAKQLRPDVLCVLVDDVREIPQTLDAEIDFLLTTKGREP
jgi:c-di-AMP phosphodiesterase-like protein